MLVPLHPCGQSSPLPARLSFSRWGEACSNAACLDTAEINTSSMGSCNPNRHSPPPRHRRSWSSSPRRCLGANSWKLIHPPGCAPLPHLSCFFTFCSGTQPHTLPRSNYQTSVGRNSCVVKCVVKHLAGWEKKGKWFIAKAYTYSIFFNLFVLFKVACADFNEILGIWTKSSCASRTKKKKSFGQMPLSSDRNKPRCSFAYSQAQLIRYRLQIKPGWWARGVGSAAP